jgi:hypothetical protein
MPSHKVMSQSNVKALPERLSISIGGHFGPSFSVRLEAGVLTYAHSKPVQQFPPEWGSRTENIQPSSEQWRVFRATLDRLNVWSWQADYLDPGICDGTNWSAEIVYPDNRIVSAGSNCFPSP